MIAYPDFTLFYIVSAIGIITTSAFAFWGVSINKIEYIFPIFALVALMIIGIVGYINPETEQWLDQVFAEIESTDCGDMEQLSKDYEIATVWQYDGTEIEDKIQKTFLYNCVDIRDGEIWWK